VKVTSGLNDGLGDCPCEGCHAAPANCPGSDLCLPRMRKALETAKAAMDERRGYAEGWEWKYGEVWNEEDAEVTAALGHA